MDAYESHLQEDGTTFPPVTRDVPPPPGVVIPEVLDPFAEPQADNLADDEGEADETVVEAVSPDAGETGSGHS